jgi:hypothetical protein
VLIDPTMLDVITPETALVLIAEMSRAVTCHQDVCDFRGREALNKEVHQILGAIGYYDYLEGIDWKPNSNATRKFMVHKTGDCVDGAVAKELIEHFRSTGDLTKEEVAALYNGLVESMTNVLQHAYPKNLRFPHLPNRWWLLGSHDKQKREISFCFYDQGIGIPRTIRTRFKDKFPAFHSDEDLLIEAVVHGQYSKTQDPTRGKGLPTLKAFFDTHTNGELTIVTHQTKCIFRKGADPVAEQMQQSLGGTLVSWTLQV